MIKGRSKALSTPRENPLGGVLHTIPKSGLGDFEFTPIIRGLVRPRLYDGFATKKWTVN